MSLRGVISFSALGILAGFLIGGTSQGQTLAERQVLVTFLDQTVMLPDSADSGAVSEAVQPTLDLYEVPCQRKWDTVQA